MYLMDIQSIYQVEIIGFVWGPQVAISIRMFDPETNYPGRPEFSINFQA